MQDTRQWRWFGTISLLIIVAISYIDRINIAVLITDAGFLQNFGIEGNARDKMGLLSTAFMIGYGLSSFVLTPFCAALFGVRRSLIIGLCLWGVVTFVSPWMQSYGLLLGSRILLGLAEGPVFALAHSYIKAHFASHENGKPSSLVQMGTGLGLAIGFPLVSLLLHSFNWENSFYALGLLNLLLGLPLVLAFIHMPKIETGQPKPESIGQAIGYVGDIVRGALQTKHIFLIAIMSASFVSYLWGSVSWLPSYFKQVHGVTVKEMGWLASLPQVFEIGAVFLGGFIIDKVRRPNVPLLFVGSGLGVSVFLWLAVQMPTPGTAVSFMVLANCCWGMASAGFPSTVQYFSKPQHIASAYGVTNGTSALVAGLMPTIMGSVMTWMGNVSPSATFYAGFGVLIGTQMVVALCGFILWKRERQPTPVLA